MINSQDKKTAGFSWVGAGCAWRAMDGTGT